MKIDTAQMKRNKDGSFDGEVTPTRFKFTSDKLIYPLKITQISVKDKTCLCTHMRNFNCWTCGATTYRLKDTTLKNADGSYQILSAEHVFKDYQYSKDGKIALPPQA